MIIQREDLLPIVQKLVELKTAKESTSVTFDTARQLMNAVIFCIREEKVMTWLSGDTEKAEDIDDSIGGIYVSKENGNVDKSDKDKEKDGLIKARKTISGKSDLIHAAKNRSAEERYEQGKQLVIEKVHHAKKIYDNMILSFCNYGNIALKETIEDGMVQFFLWYDVDLNPQNQILTLDYPTLKSVEELQGIDAIDQYLIFILLEQKFLGAFPEQEIRYILSAFHDHYEELLMNLSSIVLRNLIGKIICGIQYQQRFKDEDYEKLHNYFTENPYVEWNTQLKKIIEAFITRAKLDARLIPYLSLDIESFCVECRNALQHNCLERIFVY